MKKIISLAAGLMIAASGFSQTANAENKAPKVSAKYCCTNEKCNHCSSEPGMCSHHKTAYVKQGMYYCPMHSEATSETTGKCSKCGMDMMRMEMKKKEHKH